MWNPMASEWRLYHAVTGARCQNPGLVPRYQPPCHVPYSPPSTLLHCSTTWRVCAALRPMPRSGPWSRPMPMGTASSGCLKACAAPTALPCWTWRSPILLLEGVFEPRDLELCSRLGLWHAVHCDEQIDWLAAHKTQVPHRV